MKDGIHPSGYTVKRKITNADKIRSMTDEELAEITLYYDAECDEYLCSDGAKYPSNKHKEALKCEIKWLKSEAKSE